jgi:glycosyltransferase involved in cell wall biosynthesis
MRILFVTGEYPAMQGGVGDYTRKLGQALGELGADTHVLTHVDAGGDHLRAPASPYEPTVYPELTRHGWNLWRHVQQKIAEVKPDVVHVQYQSAAYGLHPAVNLLPARLARLRNRPIVLVTFHDLRFPYLFPKAGPLRWQSVLRLARDADASIVTNPADWVRLRNAGLGDKLRAIPIGSNIRCEAPRDYDRTAQRAKWGVQPNEWLLAYFGFLNENKGGETLIRTVAELVNRRMPAKLLMVGGKVGSSDPTNTAYLQKVENLIAELGIADRVHWTGFTSSEEVSANLMAADCAVLPYREGASLRHGSLMAALAHGLPIVSTLVSGIPPEAMKQFPMLEDGDSALLTPPDQPARMADAVIRIMTGAALRSHLAAKAAVLSRQFEWDTIAQGHLLAYRGLAR